MTIGTRAKRAEQTSLWLGEKGNEEGIFEYRAILSVLGVGRISLFMPLLGSTGTK